MDLTLEADEPFEGGINTNGPAKTKQSEGVNSRGPALEETGASMSGRA